MSDTSGTGKSHGPATTDDQPGKSSWAAFTEKELETLDNVSRNLMQASLKSQHLMSDVMRKAIEGDPVLPNADPFHSAPEFQEVWAKIVEQPDLMMRAQADLMKGYIDLWSNTTKRMMASDTPTTPAISPEPGDKRWRSTDWSPPS